MGVETFSFDLLRAGLETDSSEGKSVLPEYIDWNKLYSDGIRQGTAAIQFDGLQRLIEEGKLAADTASRSIKMQLFSHALQVEKMHKKHEEMIARLAKFYASHGIRMMVLKGYGLSLLYPHPNHRPCGDIDIWLFGEQERSDKLLHEELGVEIEENHEHHTVFHIDGVMIENHYDFLDVHTHLSNKEVEGVLRKQLETECETVMVNGAMVYLPPVNFNALFLLRHAAGHFASAEIALRHVTDWCLFVKHYHGAIDWKWLYDLAKKQNMHRFLDCLNGLCIGYLGLSKDLFPGFERDEKLEARVMEDIMNPKFRDKSAIGSNPLRDFCYRFRRWWGQRWKHKLVYREGLFLTFLVQVRSHLTVPKKVLN